MKIDGSRVRSWLDERRKQKEEERKIYQEEYQIAKAEALRESARIRASKIVEKARLDAQTSPIQKVQRFAKGFVNIGPNIQKRIGTIEHPANEGGFLGFGLDSIDYGLDTTFGSDGGVSRRKIVKKKGGNDVYDLPLI